MQTTEKTTDTSSHRADHEAGAEGISTMPPIHDATHDVAAPIQAMMGEGASAGVDAPSTPNLTGLPDTMKSNLESMSGFDMSDVRVHYNSPQPASIGALAYTQGTDIHVGPGQEKHLGHEAWHTVQQKQGRVQTNTQFKGADGNEVGVNDQSHLEREADEMGDQLASTPVQFKTMGKPDIHLNTGSPVRQLKSKSLSGDFNPVQMVGSPKLRLALDSIVRTKREEQKSREKQHKREQQERRLVLYRPNPFVGSEESVPTPTPKAKYKGKNMHGDTRRMVMKRIEARGGTAKSERIKDTFFTQESDTAYIAQNVSSMANDPAFEAAAMRFEERIGSLAHNHPKAKAVCKRATAKILAYLNKKHEEAKNSETAINEDLEKFAMGSAGWSGAVGNNIKVIKQILEEGGSVGEMVAHIEAFSTNVLMKDIMEDNVPWRDFSEEIGLNKDQLEGAYKRSAFTGDKYLGYEMPKDHAGLRQWHTRVKMVDGKGKLSTKSEHHPSSVKSKDSTKDSQTARKKEQIISKAPLGIGLKLGKHEEAFQKSKTGGDKRLAWEEGARIWALNEIDTWVFAMRQLSLPLSGGASSTTARIMQAFRFLGIDAPNDVRLAAIGALLPPRHHTLVEVMYGAAPFGPSSYTPGPQMYHQLAPLTEKEIRDAAEMYPDELFDLYGVRGGKSHESVPDPMEMEEVKSRSGFGGGIYGVLRQDKGPEIEELDDPVRFNLTRQHIRTNHNITRGTRKTGTTARMLNAMDAYHAMKEDDPKRFRLLLKIQEEAELWLSRHENETKTKIGAWFKTYEVAKHSTRKLNAYRNVRDAAKAAIKDYEARYLLDMSQDKMLASSSHVTSPIIKESTRTYGTIKNLAKKHGLTEAEVVAINTYCGPAYKFINASLDGSDNARIKERLGGMVREIKTSSAIPSGKRKGASEELRRKLVNSKDPIKRGKTETLRHASVAMMGLAKLPAYTGKVYAGGCLTKGEALARFATGSVSERNSFASTTYQEMTAGMFAFTKHSNMVERYDASADQNGMKEPFRFILRYTSRTGRKIEDFSPSTECEVLFAPGSKLRIVRGADSPLHEKDVRSDSVTHYIDAEEV